MIFRLGENETEMNIVLIQKRRPVVVTKREGNARGLSTHTSDSRYR